MEALALDSTVGEQIENRDIIHLKQEKFSTMREEYGKRLRVLREKLGMTQKVFAAELGIKEHQVKDAESGKTNGLPSEGERQLVVKFSVSLNWLIAGRGDMYDFLQEVPPATHQDSYSVSCAENRYFDFAFVKKVKPRLSAGTGEFVYEEECNELYSFRTDWLTRKGSISAMKLAEVSGDSMLPTLQHGDWVLFDTSRTDPLDGRIMVVSVDGLLFVKRVRISPEGIFLVSDNRAVYEPWALRPIGDNIRFIGLVIWHCGEI